MPEFGVSDEVIIDFLKNMATDQLTDRHEEIGMADGFLKTVLLCPLPYAEFLSSHKPLRITDQVPRVFSQLARPNRTCKHP